MRPGTPPHQNPSAATRNQPKRRHARRALEVVAAFSVVTAASFTVWAQVQVNTQVNTQANIQLATLPTTPSVRYGQTALLPSEQRNVAVTSGMLPSELRDASVRSGALPSQGLTAGPGTVRYSSYNNAYNQTANNQAASSVRYSRSYATPTATPGTAPAYRPPAAPRAAIPKPAYARPTTAARSYGQPMNTYRPAVTPRGYGTVRYGH